MNEPCRNIGCNYQRNGRCTGVACGGADTSNLVIQRICVPFTDEKIHGVFLNDRISRVLVGQIRENQFTPSVDANELTREHLSEITEFIRLQTSRT